MTDTNEILTHGQSTVTLYRNAPDWDGRRCMSLGNIKFHSASDGTDLISMAVTTARAEGFDAIIGPMNGDTWHSYRVVTETDNSPAFMLEPVSGPYDLEAFQSAHFKVISEYVSSKAPLSAAIAATPPHVTGISVTPWNGTDAEALVKTIFELSAQSFAKNRFFKPLDLSGFNAIYFPLLSAIDPTHVLIARSENGQICGFLFGYPDAASEQKTIVLKTYASGVRGVGFILADTFHRRAYDLGFEFVIHALMHQDNISLDRSRRHQAQIFRRYALMGRILDSDA